VAAYQEDFPRLRREETVEIGARRYALSESPEPKKMVGKRIPDFQMFQNPP
jgi:hypothetical protein